MKYISAITYSNITDNVCKFQDTRVTDIFNMTQSKLTYPHKIVILFASQFQQALQQQRNLLLVRKYHLVLTHGKLSSSSRKISVYTVNAHATQNFVSVAESSVYFVNTQLYREISQKRIRNPDSLKAINTIRPYSLAMFVRNRYDRYKYHFSVHILCAFTNTYRQGAGWS